VLLPPGIGTRPPRRIAGAYVRSARCYGPIVSLDPTGLLLVRPGATRTLGAAFAAWGQPLSRGRLLSFASGRGRVVRAYVAGRRVAGDPRAIALLPHRQIVVEVGRFVAPHRRYAFPPATRGAR
jgi:hypothetical protein